MLGEQLAPQIRKDLPASDVSTSVERRRIEIEEYLDRMQARQRRALNLAIVAVAFASMLTASATIGGQRLANWLILTSGLTSPAWQVMLARNSLLPRRGNRDAATEITQR